MAKKVKRVNQDVRNNAIMKHFNEGGDTPKAPVQNSSYRGTGIYDNKSGEQIMAGPASQKVLQSQVPLERYNPNSVNRNTKGKAYSKLKKGGQSK